MLNGTETKEDAKPVPAPAAGPVRANGHAAEASKPMPGPRAKNEKKAKEAARKDADSRFFLAAKEGAGGVPSLGKECASETEAIIESFRTEVPYFIVKEFRTKAEIDAAGVPSIKQEIIRRSNHHYQPPPAS